MHTFSVRRLLGALVTSLVATTGLMVAAAPAHAAPTGYLLLKGAGSVYTANPIVNLGITPGTTKTWSVKIVNTGATRQQFKVTVGQDPATPVTLLAGSTAVDLPYYTAPVPVGGSLTLSMKVSAPVGTSTVDHYNFLNLKDPETNTVLDQVEAVANVTTQTGTKPNDLFVKTGSQPYVGGSVVEYTTAAALKPGNTATFTVRLRNDGGFPTSITVSDDFSVSCPSAFAAAVKQGTHDITAAVVNGGYSTSVLSPGQHLDLKLTVKLLTPTSCTAAYYGLQASDGVDSLNVSYAHVVTGV